MVVGPTLLLMALCLSATPDAAQDDRQEVANIQGTWLVETAHEGGQPIPKERREKARLIIDGSRFTLHDGESTFKGELTLHFTQKPKAADVFVEVPGNETVGILAIYKLEKETLTICLTKVKQRPTEFKTVLGDPNAILVMKRKAEPKPPH
jgi:uncharacterized protein (TIGR03067 family)